MSPPSDAPARAPNLHASTERFVRTIKDSCLERMGLIGEGSRRRAVREFVAHYHHERNHQGLDHRLILPLSTAHRHPVVASSAASGSVGCCTTTIGQQRDT